jgi:hypothetical protein
MARQASTGDTAGEKIDSDCRRTVSFGFERTRKMVRDDLQTGHVDNADGLLMTMMHICSWRLGRGSQMGRVAAEMLHNR